MTNHDSMTLGRTALEMDPTEERARELQALLSTSRGIPCNVHWDRSPWGVRIPLISDFETNMEDVPALYVLTEGTRTVAGHEGTWVWFGQLAGFGEDDETSGLSDTVFEWIERHWLGHHVESIADALEPLVPILKLGADRANALLHD